METKSTWLCFTYLFIVIMAGAQNNGIAKTGLPGATQDTWYGDEADQSIKLRWSSANEGELSHYELQRSADGKVFETIALVFSLNGTNNIYNYIDKRPLDGMNYYQYHPIHAGGKHRSGSFHASGNLLAAGN